MVLEADGYQPYLISPEKGLRALVRKVLELAKDPGRQCVDEVSAIIYPIFDANIKAICALCCISLIFICFIVWSPVDMEI